MKTFKKGILVILIIATACTGKNNPGDAASSIEKAKPVHKEITAELIGSLKDSELEQVIFDNIETQITAAGSDVDAKLKSLSKGQRAIYVTWITEAEVEESGLIGFYSGSGKQLADYVVESFQTIGANGFAGVMQQADAIYRAQQNAAGKDPYDSLEDAFDSMHKQESLDQLKVDFIRKNVEDFVTH